MKSKTLQLLLSVAVLSLATLLAAACSSGERPSEPEEPQEIAIPVKVEGDSLHPETIRVTQGDMVTLQIESERTGQFHLHGYDLEKEIPAGEPTEFFFTAHATGRYRITMHYSGPAAGDSDGGGDHHEGQGNQEDGGSESDHHEGGGQDSGESSSQGEGETDLGFLEVSPQ